MYPLIIPISGEPHAILAAWQARALAQTLDFSVVDQTALSTAVLEVAKNIVKYAIEGQGEVEIKPVEARGVEIIARDAGPGIPDIKLAMTDGYSTGKSLGLGLPGAKRLMSTFEIHSQAGQGTTIIMRKFRRERA
jgi:serine/threonine-protein kinase RsbT